MLASTSLARPAFLSTSIAVAMSVNASTPLRRKIVSPSTGVEVLSSCSTVRVTSGRSWSMAASMLATRVAVRRRAAILFCSTSKASSRRRDQIVEAPKPTTMTATISRVILVASLGRSIETGSALGGGDDLGQLLGFPRVERAQAVEYRLGLGHPSHLDVGLAEVLERFRVVGAQAKRLLVGPERVVVLLLVAQGVPEPIPGFREGPAEPDGVAVRRLRLRPFLLLGEGPTLVVAVLRIPRRRSSPGRGGSRRGTAIGGIDEPRHGQGQCRHGERKGCLHAPMLSRGPEAVALTGQPGRRKAASQAGMSPVRFPHEHPGQLRRIRGHQP